jgi:hypothetical protein
MPAAANPAGWLSEFNVDDKVQVCKISHSDFVKADPQWPQEEGVAS